MRQHITHTPLAVFPWHTMKYTDTHIGMGTKCLYPYFSLFTMLFTCSTEACKPQLNQVIMCTPLYLSASTLFHYKIGKINNIRFVLAWSMPQLYCTSSETVYNPAYTHSDVDSGIGSSRIGEQRNKKILCTSEKQINTKHMDTVIPVSFRNLCSQQ